MNPITTNGIYFFPQAFASGRKVLMDLCGTFGGATVRPGFRAADGQFSPYLGIDGSTPLEVSGRGGFEARVARNNQVGVEVLNAGAETSIILDVIPAVDMPPGA
jgi:hypothetical protein